MVLEYKDALEFLNTSDWCSLSSKQKTIILQAVENHMAEIVGRDPCNVISEAMGNKKGITIMGYYESGTDNIYLNSDALENSCKYGRDYKKALDTVIHEGRHCTQEKAVSGQIQLKDVTPEIVNEWKENLKPGNYIRPEKNLFGYYNQPIERDARSYGRMGVDMVLNDKVELSQQKALQQENGMSIA